MNKFRIAKAGINVNEGIERMCGDTDAFEGLLSKFPEDTHFQELLKAIEDKNVEQAFSAGHALKGIAGNMSMTKLYEAICPLVECLRAGNIDVASYIPDITESYEKVLNAIVDMNNSRNNR